MRSLPPLLSMALLVFVALAPSARAQCPEDVRMHIQRELDVTDTRLEQAASIVGDNAPARLELRAARDTQGEARAEFAAQRCRIAMDLTLRARFRATRAIEIARGHGEPGLPDPSRVLGQLERTRDLLERARDRIEECNQERARGMLRAAFDMQHRAEEALGLERPLAAFQLTVSARERALRALRLCNMQDNLQESAEHALRRTDDALARARHLLADHDVDRARHLLGRAIEMQTRAQAEFRAERYESSLRLTQSARTLAQRAIRLAGGTT